MKLNSSRKMKRISIPVRLAGSRLGWDYALGPGYNRRMKNMGEQFPGALLDVVMDAKDIPGKARILDVGCGPGLLALALAERYPDAEVFGVDNSDRQVRGANRLLSRKGLGNCSFKAGRAEDLPFGDGRFDIVVSTWSISCWRDMRKGLEEIRRVLVEDGVAFIADADSGAPVEDIRAFTGGYASAGRCKRLTEWFTRRFVFGPSIALTGDEAAAIAGTVDFSTVMVERKSPMPFFRMKLVK